MINFDNQSCEEDDAEMATEFERFGFVMRGGVLSEEEVRGLRAELGVVEGAGRRGLLRLGVVADLACSGHVMDLVRPFLAGTEPVPVRAIFFDKSPEGNWLVPWHQDLTIAVGERREVEGFGPWSVKEGTPHVQPPIPLLERMVTVRLHLDDADEENGALRVLPSSHLLGRLSAEGIQEVRGGATEVVCRARAGDALVMRPLILHASGRSTTARHRRVLHLEYAGFELPGGLQWEDGAS